MPVREEFNAETFKQPPGYTLYLVGENAIRGILRDSVEKNPSTYGDYIFDFMNRTVVVSPWGSSAATQVFTFAQFDEGSIEWHYHQLVQMGKNPRPPASLEQKPGAPLLRNALKP